jgi:dihydrofolate synthase / folylpolyglutamate synthase
VNVVPPRREAPRPFSYTEALAWLYSLQRFGIKLGLENIRRLIADLHADFGNARVIHVAGTNGKGSVCAMIDSICRAQNYRTALFTSPHLVTFRERIRVSGEMISENEVAAGLTNIRKLVADWEPHPTFFEITTALALKHFADAGRHVAKLEGQLLPENSPLPSPSPLPSVRGERIKVRGGSNAGANIDIVILETGLGGRLDATNAIQSNVALITPIALDHQAWLGDSLEKIAGEKAGIIKARTPVVSAPQLPEVAAVIRARAAECEAPLQFVDETYGKSPIALRGDYQKLNAAIAIAAIRAAKIDPPSPNASPARTSGATGIGDAAIARGLATVEWPGRFQCWDKRTVIDGAHNPAAAKILAQTWREIFDDQRATLILAILSDKDLRGICEALVPIADSVVLPKIRSERAVEPTGLAEILASIPSFCRAGASPAGDRLPSQSSGAPGSGCPTITIASSFAEAFDRAREQRDPILITGSLHFAGEALAYLQGRPAAFEECTQ